MRLIICDPNLERASGHHWFLDLAIAKEAVARGMEAYIIAHRSFGQRTIDEVQIIPRFQNTCYARKSRHAVSGEHDDFRTFNDGIYDDLSLLPLDLFNVNTLVLFPTVSQRHLYGAIRWMKDFPSSVAPTFVVYLMLPSGIEPLPGDAKGYKVLNPLTALHYRLAFETAKGPGSPIHFFGTGLSHAREYSLLAERAVPPHPVVLSGMSQTPPALPATTAAARPNRSALLFMGDAKPDKGFLLLPAIASELSARFPEWTFHIHANCGNIWGESKQVHLALKSLAEQQENIQFQDGFISTEEYARLLSQADLVVAPYSPVEYGRKSSGVAWEAIWCGLPLVVPANTWLSEETGYWGGDCEGFDEWTAESITGAILRLIERLDRAQAEAAAAALGFRRRNSLRLLMNQLADVWLSRLSLGAISKLSTYKHLQLDKLTTPGWFEPESVDGRVVRWSAQQVHVDVELDADSPWRFVFEGASMMGEDQVTRAVLTADGREVQMTATVNPEGQQPRWRLQGVLGPAQTSTALTRLVLTLPYTYRPESEKRSLGLLFTGALRFIRTVNGPAQVFVDRPRLRFVDDRTLRTVESGEVAHTVSDWACASVTVDPSRALDIVAEIDLTQARALECAVNGFAGVRTMTPLSPSRVRVCWKVPAVALGESGREASVLFVAAPEAGPIKLFSAYGAPAMPPGAEAEPLPAPPPPEPIASPRPVSKLPAIPDDGVISFIESTARPFMQQGWGDNERDHIWMTSNQAGLAFHVPDVESQTLVLEMNLLTLADVEARGGRLSISINGRPIGEIRPRRKRHDFRLEFGADLLGPAGDILMQLDADMTGRPPGEARDLAVSFYSLSVRAKATSDDDTNPTATPSTLHE